MLPPVTATNPGCKRCCRRLPRQISVASLAGAGCRDKSRSQALPAPVAATNRGRKRCCRRLQRQISVASVAVAGYNDKSRSQALLSPVTATNLGRKRCCRRLQRQIAVASVAFAGYSDKSRSQALPAPVAAASPIRKSCRRLSQPSPGGFLVASPRVPPGVRPFEERRVLVAGTGTTSEPTPAGAIPRRFRPTQDLVGDQLKTETIDVRTSATLRRPLRRSKAPRLYGGTLMIIRTAVKAGSGPVIDPSG